MYMQQCDIIVEPEGVVLWMQNIFSDFENGPTGDSARRSAPKVDQMCRRSKLQAMSSRLGKSQYDKIYQDEQIDDDKNSREPTPERGSTRHRCSRPRYDRSTRVGEGSSR